MLEEERHLRIEALVADIDGPTRLHRPRTWAAFAADDHPIDAGKVEFTDGPDQRFHREKADGGVGFLEVSNAGCLRGLDEWLTETGLSTLRWRRRPSDSF